MARPELQPQMQSAIELLAGTPLNELPPGEARAVQRERFTRFNQPLRGVRRVADHFPRGPDGVVPLRLIEPLTAPGTGPAATLVYFHGGGWVNGSHATVEPQCRYLAHAAGCLVISVEYRLAPESPFPAAVEDAIWACEWLHDHAADFRIDPQRLAVGRDSAGATPAAVVAQTWVRGDRHPLAAQLLLFPVMDLAFATPSFEENRDGPHLTRALMDWFVGHYAPNPDDRGDVRASPLRAKDVSGVAPATIITASHDPLRDEGASYAAKLRAAGVPVAYRNWEGYTHSFTNWTGVVDAAFEALDFAADGLCEAFAASA